MKTAMKAFWLMGLAIVLALFFASSELSAQQNGGKKAGKGFVDLNGDGINDYAIDSDGDGIPNCLDPDYVRPMDGTGRKLMRGQASKFGKGGNGPANGTGNQGIGPKDGTGYGASGTPGVCDGTGPKGKGKRAGRK